jgi:hypothetical protein
MNSTAYDYFVIIPRANDSQILLLADQDGWTLPHFELAGHHESSEVDKVNEAVRSLLGIEVTARRCLYFNFDPLIKHVSLLFLLENHSPDWLPPASARWTSRHELEGLKLSRPDQRIFLESFFAGNETEELARPCVPWARAGWFDEAAAWIKQELGRNKLELVGPIEQRRNWFRSAILRVQTDAGAAYFKASPQMFRCEAALTMLLAAECPARMPRVLAADPERNWLLMRDFGKTTLSEVEDVTLWEETLRAYAQIQIAYAARVEEILRLGCPDLRLDKLAAQIDTILADPLLPLTGRQWRRLSASEVAELRSLAPHLKRMCGRLKGYGVPETLEHGDLHDRNIILNGRDFLYFDWSDACITHPFFGLSIFFRFQEMENCLPRVRERLRDAFLAGWARFGPTEYLIEAYELAYRLAPLFHALFYHRVILSQLETAARWETDNMLPFWLRILLREKQEILDF